MKKLLAAILLLPSLAFGQSVQQSGQITPGHAVQWITNGIIGDGGVPGGPIFTGSTTVNDFACVGMSGTIIDCGLSATSTNNWPAQQNFNGGATAPTRAFGDSTTNVATTAFVQAAAGSNPVQGPITSVVGHPAIFGNTTGSTVTDPTSITYISCAGVNDTAALTAAFLASNGKILVINPGVCLTDPQTISQSNSNAPQQIYGYGATIRARASSASPTLTIENIQGLINDFGVYGLILDANSLHAYALKIHGSQFAYYQNVEAKGGTSGGVWLSGEPGFGIYYTTFNSVYSHNNTGPGFIMKSINNTGNYYIAADTFFGLRSIGNSTYGYDLDYASAGLYGSEAETNSTCGVNIDHAIQIDLASMHIEANNGTPCAISGTANTKNLKVQGGRTIGTVTGSLKADSSNQFNTGDTNANAMNRSGVVYAAAYGVTCDGSTNDTAAINAALLGANAKILVFPAGGSCLVTPGGIVIGAGVNNVPNQMLGYGTLIFANTVVASPLLTVDTPENSGQYEFVLAGFKFSCTGSGAGKGAYALKIHGSQFAVYRDLQMVGGCTAGGLWLSGEPNAGIYNNLFEHIVISGMTGPGLIAKSINNTGNYYISANAWTGITSIFNTTYGADLDYASIAIADGDLESNTTAGLNVDHAIQVDLFGVHFEANNGGSTAITTTANTSGLRVIGGRTIGSISVSALNNQSNAFNTSDVSGSAIIRPISGVTRYCQLNVNFNVGATDTAIAISPLQSGRYIVNSIRLNNASASISTATVGVFTGLGGTGQTVAANQAITVTATATDANNNTMALTLTNAATEAYNDTALQIRVGTPQGSAATADLCVYIFPLT